MRYKHQIEYLVDVPACFGMRYKHHIEYLVDVPACFGMRYKHHVLLPRCIIDHNISIYSLLVYQIGLFKV